MEYDEHQVQSVFGMADIGDDSECWRWGGTMRPHGYGTVSIGGATRGSHAVAFEMTKGAVPDGLEIDHLCHTRDCINPAHMEAVTHAENMRRRISTIGGGLGNSRKTHCIRGHPFDDMNTWQTVSAIGSPVRQCKKCHALRESARRAAARGAA